MRAAFTVLGIWAAYNLRNIAMCVYFLRTWAPGAAKIMAKEDKSGGIGSARGRVQLMTLAYEQSGHHAYRVEPERPPDAKVGDTLSIRINSRHPDRFRSENWLRRKIAANVFSIGCLLMLGGIIVMLRLTQ